MTLDDISGASLPSLHRSASHPEIASLIPSAVYYCMETTANATSGSRPPSPDVAIVSTVPTIPPTCSSITITIGVATLHSATVTVSSSGVAAGTAVITTAVTMSSLHNPIVTSVWVRSSGDVSCISSPQRLQAAFTPLTTPLPQRRKGTPKAPPALPGKSTALGPMPASSGALGPTPGLAGILGKTRVSTLVHRDALIDYFKSLATQFHTFTMVWSRLFRSVLILPAAADHETVEEELTAQGVIIRGIRQLATGGANSRPLNKFLVTVDTALI
ncbi:hypothetical protein PR048_002451 [Dryococelus australis]|uniref:Uncharacterized protein n=1 Tax=Dryococelus australis TaxID=614101 RepID=A0ABQ9IK83_9NEOP|nr:hypothetical protein PR048_002451 [Dryococelus australis]